jgi:ubiquinone/menaquinone biosynthesis C-methylase UbiE
MTIYDSLAEHYDNTRGGEERGDEFAAELDRRLPSGQDPVLEVGVGTGVVALGLRRRGRVVIGVDLAAAMLERAAARLGAVVVRGDARRLPFADASVPHAISVWVIHAVDLPEALFAEAARVVRPGGRYHVFPTNRIAGDDPIESILSAMFARAEQLHPTWRQRHVPAGDILAWGTQTGFDGHVEALAARSWVTSAAEQAQSIRDRVWRALQGLDDDAFEEVTRPAFEAFAALPDGPIVQRAEADVVVLCRS